MNFCEIRSTTMNLMYENLARAQCQERLQQAREARQGHHLARALRLARRAERAAVAVRLHLARVV